MAVAKGDVVRLSKEWASIYGDREYTVIDVVNGNVFLDIDGFEKVPEKTDQQILDEVKANMASKSNGAMFDERNIVVSVQK